MQHNNTKQVGQEAWQLLQQQQRTCSFLVAQFTHPQVCAMQLTNHLLLACMKPCWLCMHAFRHPTVVPTPPAHTPHLFIPPHTSTHSYHVAVQPEPPTEAVAKDNTERSMLRLGASTMHTQNHLGTATVGPIAATMLSFRPHAGWVEVCGVYAGVLLACVGCG